MNKIISIILACFFTLNGLGASAMIEKTIDYSLFNDSFDMVIITPNIFISKLQPLVEHKNNYGFQW